jgi:acetoin utilization protein AcuB
MLVRSRMTRDVVTAAPQTTLAEALKLLQKHVIRHLPVVEDGRLLGLISDRDLRLLEPAPGGMSDEQRSQILTAQTLRDVMTTNVDSTSPDTPIEEAARQLHMRHIGCLPVLEGQQLVGIITTTDLLRGMIEIFGLDRPSSRLEVRTPNRPGELARVVRAIGIEAKVNITAMVLVPLNATEAVFVIRVETLDPRPIVEALQKLGYDAAWPSLDLELPASPGTTGSGPRASIGDTALPGALNLAATIV